MQKSNISAPSTGMDNCKFINMIHGRLGHSGNAPFILLAMQ